MKKLLKGILTLFIVALVVLLGLAYFEKEHGLNVPASSLLLEIKVAFEDVTKSADVFLQESGIKEDTAELLEKGAELLKTTPAPEEPPATTPDMLPDTEPPAPSASPEGAAQN